IADHFQPAVELAVSVNVRHGSVAVHRTVHCFYDFEHGHVGGRPGQTVTAIRPFDRVQHSCRDEGLEYLEEKTFRDTSGFGDVVRGHWFAPFFGRHVNHGMEGVTTGTG